MGGQSISTFLLSPYHTFNCSEEDDTCSNATSQPVKEDQPVVVMLQYRGRTSDAFAKKLQCIANGLSIVFTNRKLKTCLLSLKGSFSQIVVELSTNSHVQAATLATSVRQRDIYKLGKRNIKEQLRQLEHISASVRDRTPSYLRLLIDVWKSLNY